MRGFSSKIVLLFLFGVIFAACSRGEKTAPVPVSSSSAVETPAKAISPGNAAPEVISAVFTPSKPTRNMQLMIQCSTRDAENDQVNLSFRWYVDNELVQEGPDCTLAAGKYKKGSEVYGEITSGDAYGTGKTFRTETITIGNLPPSMTAVSVSPPDPPVGAVITALPEGVDPDGDELKFMYQWLVNGKAIEESQSNTFSTAGLRKKDSICVTVRPSDGQDNGPPRMSNVLILSNSAPKVVSTPPYEVVNGEYSYQVTAKDPDGDSLTYRLLAGPQGMTIDSAGLIRWTPPRAVAEPREVAVEISVDDGDGGVAHQKFTFIMPNQ